LDPLLDPSLDPSRWLAPFLGVEPAVVPVALAAVLARVSAAIWLAPFLGGKLVPATVKTGLSLLLTAVVFPQVAASASGLAGASPLLVAAVVAKEALVGAALGFVVAIIFWAAEAAGRLADTARGANMAEVLVPQTGARTSPLGDLFFLLTLVLFIVLGGHRIFVTTLGASYQVLPIAHFPTSSGLGGFAMLCGRLTSDLLLIALTLSAPVLAAIFLADVTLGVINRFAPQINVYFLAMPAKAVLGIAILALSVGVLLTALPPLLDQAVQMTERGLGMLGR
jgi:flagellar biosynthetic protein FliR